MKDLRLVLFLLLIVSGAQIKAQDIEAPLVVLKTSQEKEYVWDAVTSSWQLSALMDYDYNPDGDLTEIVKYGAINGDSISLINYYYAGADVLLSYEVSTWQSQAWNLNTKYSYTYSQSREESQLIQAWNGSEWVNKSYDSDYSYDPEGLLIQSENYRWKNGSWLADHTIIYEYGENNKVSRKYSLSVTGAYLSQVFYLYDANNKISEMYAQFYRNGQWENGWRRTYIYDKCRELKTVLRESWVSGGWVFTTKSEYVKEPFYYATDGSVVLCHKGRTVKVPIDEVESHLMHGDCLGPCQGVPPIRDKSYTGFAGQLSYTVYPNPVITQFTVSAKDPLIQIKKVDIYDMKGSLVKSVRNAGSCEVIIDRGALKSGKYYVKVSGDIAENLIVIFE